MIQYLYPTLSERTCNSNFLLVDIFDKELNDLRKMRWHKAFETSAGSKDDDLRATIVMEHIIQASDVAHTMQHWQYVSTCFHAHLPLGCSTLHLLTLPGFFSTIFQCVPQVEPAFVFGNASGLEGRSYGQEPCRVLVSG